MNKTKLSISSALKQKSYSVALKISIFLFIFFSVFLFWGQAQQKINAINEKVEIDRELVLNALKIGDLFFITKYVSSFVDSEAVVFAGIKSVEQDEWISLYPTDTSYEVFSSKLSLGSKASRIVRHTKISGSGSESWEFIYSYELSHIYLVYAFLLSLMISALIFLFLRTTLSSTAGYFVEPLKNLVKDIDNQKSNVGGKLQATEYQSAHQFIETDQLVKEINDLLEEIGEQQDELQKTEVLKALNKMSRQVSHDIQSPLGALRVGVGSMRSNPKASASLIEKAVERIVLMVSDLKVQDFVKVEEALKKTPANLNQFLTSLVEEKRAEYKEQDILFELQLCDEAITLDMDQGKMARAISNIINNGIEAVVSKTARINVILSKQDEVISIEIVDNGQGITEKEKKKIFEYGYTSSKKNGSGTGLSYAKEIIEAHQGKITTTSAPLKGTTLRIVL